MKNDDIRNQRLVPLRAMSDYKVAKASTDVVGWRVVGADGEGLGTVKDLIVDPQLMKVRYLAVLAENKFFNTDKDQHTLIPIGAAALDKRGKNVFVSYLDSKTIGRYPVYTGEHISEEYEYAIRDSIQQSQNSILPGTSDTYRQEFNESISGERTDTRPISADFYENDAYDANRFYTSDQDLNRDRDRTYTEDEQHVTRERILSTSSDDDYDRTDTTTSDYDRTNTTASDYDNRDAGTTYRDESSSSSIKSKSVEDSIATIERLEGLRKRGSITEEEFILMKKRALDQ